MKKIFNFKRVVLICVFTSLLCYTFVGLSNDPSIEECTDPGWRFWGYSYGCAWASSGNGHIANSMPDGSYCVVLIPYERYILGIMIEQGTVEKKIACPENH
ncbi:hypothetical protein G9H64_11950 [Aquirufa nivalisilvae]|jgi:hypothetical protein|uniref:hypothetical protein n=1 Tax=Aquirufa nivalisilvae TaxID=2516557 RepID=UPI0022A95FC9|nr:hypothetical protein [Aquirufa nivalisilvae]MCZ2478937.1 hypothetical protein [Aquirufa nivalisilvae]MCZ2483671.1 hypothetical protein [Aquirufa nivalisilvae]